MNSSRVSFRFPPVVVVEDEERWWCSFRLVKRGDAIEVGDEDKKGLGVILFGFMMAGIASCSYKWYGMVWYGALLLLGIRDSGFGIQECEKYRSETKCCC